MGLLQAERSSAWFSGGVFLRAARDVADPQRPHEFQAGKPFRIVRAPFPKLGVLRLPAGYLVAHDGVAEVLDHGGNGECTAEAFIQTRFCHAYLGSVDSIAIGAIGGSGKS